MKQRTAVQKRTVKLRFVILAAAGAALLGVPSCSRRLLSDDDDRSRIIVRSGSIDFEQDVAWEYESSTDKKKAHPVQPNGAAVTGFMVEFDRTDISGTSCPQVPVVGDSVDFEYQPSGGSSETVSIGAKLLGGKNAPLVTAPGDMTVDNGGSQKKLTYGAPGGSIASVTVHYRQASQKCTPNGGKFTNKIDVKPLR
jgi:hypothetical protein